MERHDWLILLLGFKGETESPELDPIRIQKGMFLLAQEGGLPSSERYEFAPHLWGPFSHDLRNDLSRLALEGYVQALDAPGYRWKKYALTAAGIERARELLATAPRETAHQVAAIKRTITGVSFSGLLGDVYSRYPEFATRSLFSS